MENKTGGIFGEAPKYSTPKKTRGKIPWSFLDKKDDGMHERDNIFCHYYFSQMYLHTRPRVPILYIILWVIVFDFHNNNIILWML